MGQEPAAAAAAARSQVKCASRRPAIILSAGATAAALEARCLPLKPPGALGCCCAPPVGCCGAGCLAAPAASAPNFPHQSSPAAVLQAPHCPRCCCCCAAAAPRWRGASALAGWAAPAATGLQRPPAPENSPGWESAWQAAPTAADTVINKRVSAAGMIGLLVSRWRRQKLTCRGKAVQLHHTTKSDVRPELKHSMCVTQQATTGS